MASITVSVFPHELNILRSNNPNPHYGHEKQQSIATIQASANVHHRLRLHRQHTKDLHKLPSIHQILARRIPERISSSFLCYCLSTQFAETRNERRSNIVLYQICLQNLGLEFSNLAVKWSSRILGGWCQSCLFGLVYITLSYPIAIPGI